MSFADSIRTLAGQIKDRRQHVQTEEAAKQALILPFIAALGFDIWNPAELIPEYRAGWAKQSEKIDYALLIVKKLAIFVEAKGPNEVLVNHDPQLAKYFNSTPEVRFCIITNGIQYRFFTDLQEKNLLDKKPFFEFNFEDFNDSDVAVLDRFRKDVFNADNLIGYAEDLVFLSALKNQFKGLLREPSDEFVRFAVVAAGLVEGRITQKVVDRFRPLVKESVSAAILEIVGQSFLQQQPLDVPVAAAAEDEIAVAADDNGSRVETTEEELAVFEKLCHMLAEYVPDPGKLRHRDTTGYFGVQYAKTTGWFARFLIQGRDRKVVAFRLPAEKVQALAPGWEIESTPNWLGNCRIQFDTLDQLGSLQDVFVAAVQEVL